MLIEVDVKQDINEPAFQAFGQAVFQILHAMMNKQEIPVSIKGSKSFITIFSKTLKSEKEFLDTLLSNGLESIAAKKNKLILDQNIEEFERITGIPWPVR